MAEMAVGNRPEFRRGHVDYAASRFALGQELSKDARVHYAPGQTVARSPLFSTSARRDFHLEVSTKDLVRRILTGPSARLRILAISLLDSARTTNFITSR